MSRLGSGGRISDTRSFVYASRIFFFLRSTLRALQIGIRNVRRLRVAFPNLTQKMNSLTNGDEQHRRGDVLRTASRMSTIGHFYRRRHTEGSSARDIDVEEPIWGTVRQPSSQ